MNRNDFDSAVTAILDDLTQLNDDFVQDVAFSQRSSVAKTLESLACQVNNLRVFLVEGYHDSFYRTIYGSEK